MRGNLLAKANRHSAHRRMKAGPKDRIDKEVCVADAGGAPRAR
jgi:hypothetical protein